jgi:Replication Fork Protection Component Swi3
MHDVFPKAKFRDCIQLTVAAGSDSKLRAQREQWIEMAKPKPITMEDGANVDEEGLDALRSAERESTGSFLNTYN